ncbi:hypothetical protein SERLADRAFT_432156 [Serpula lacrymans var. lacrymans S7.9]|uniref:Uncharacterized protein n=1 Tax=Serpula lacrymans var. lacrymans (strain S7.9) TaxID=578457 RepID=F8NEF1_SERL9|nr:uncharacterized protein SERLADRAFT_432156 [Serpula lacrymans var. lacrymans S7.9]EGO30585.1 hypothetical protein SERLADRAFT_432156 [Serpula lacrymans var. lacrymans S7.9]
MPASDAGMTIGNPESLANLPTSDTNLKVTGLLGVTLNDLDGLPLAQRRVRRTNCRLPQHFHDYPPKPPLPLISAVLSNQDGLSLQLASSTSNPDSTIAVPNQAHFHFLTNRMLL